MNYDIKRYFYAKQDQGNDFYDPVFDWELNLMLANFYRVDVSLNGYGENSWESNLIFTN